MLSQIAISVQSSLIDIERIQWPVCRYHSRLLSVDTNDTGAVWVCPTPDEHIVAPIGGLGAVASQLRA